MARFSSVQLSHSVISDSLQSHGLQHARLPCPSPTPRACSIMSIESAMPSNYVIFCHPLLLPPLIFSSIRVFSKESVLCIKWPKYWSFSFNISPSSEYSGLISFRMKWLDFLVVQGTLKSLLQHQSSKASILWHSALFMVQLSHLYMTTGKTIVLTIQTFVSKVTSLLFNMLSRFVTGFLQFWLLPRVFLSLILTYTTWYKFLAESGLASAPGPILLNLKLVGHGLWLL